MIDCIHIRRVLPVYALAVLLASPAAFVAAEDGTTPASVKLQAGAATSNITPPLGTRIVGGFAPYPAEHIHDELHARCLVLDDGQTRLALVVCDLLGLHRSVSVEARRLIEEGTGIPPQNVLISATHTHSAGTALGHNRYANEQELDDYQQFVARRIADGVRRALNLLRPAEVAFTRVDVPEEVHNRRWLMREGTVPPNPFDKIDKVKTNPPARSPDLVKPAGPVDPAVSIIALRDPDGRLISAYCAYSLHYVGGSGPAHVSADYFAMFCEALKRRQPEGDVDPPFVALLANGTSGDINNIDRLNPHGSRAQYQRMREVAEDVAGKVDAALDRIESWQDRVTLAARSRELQLDWRKVEPELLEWAKDVEAQAPRVPGGNVPVGARFATEREWVQRLSYSSRVQLLAEAKGPALVPVQVLRIGDIVIGTSPCETFAEIGLEFKQRSPLPHSFMVSLAHGYIGYLPTPRHFELGGYETWPGTNYLEPQTSVKMLDALIEMTARLTPQGEIETWLGEPKFEMQRLFEGERFPNVVVARDGSVLATWGSRQVRVRRSEDGGETWGPEIAIGDGIHGGGVIVDENSGDVLVFAHPEHPPRDGQTAPRTVYRSTDHGKTWQKDEATFHKDARGFVPSLHMMEHGTTLLRGEHKGRLIRAARVYRTSPDRYATTIFSDDGGRNWLAGQPFAESGTGEAALIELSDGRLLGTARKSFFAKDEPLRHERVFATSDDGGQTWRDAVQARAIPDGPRYRDTDRRGANYNGHFGMFNGLTRLPIEGRDILIYSNADHDGHERIRMTVWASFDGGKTWPIKRLVHEGLSAYSSLAAGRNGTPSEGWIYLQFEQGAGQQQYAGCQTARFNLAWLLAGQLTGDGDVPEELTASQPAFLRPPRVITDPGSEYAGATRRFQGIPSLARSSKGRLWATWYGGRTPGEDHNNYVVLVTSGDEGRTWSAEQVVIDPDGDGPVRAFDPELWLDPDGRMWAFWAQADGHDASIGGVWAITSDNPDDEDARWSAPRRLTDGVMMCKPTVLSSGEWCLPASTWRKTDHSARMVVSTDRGQTWQVRGGCNVPADVRAFDEHIIIERNDRSLWLLARTRYGIGESVSTDRGATWTELKPSPIAHPSARFFVRRLRSGNLLLAKHGPLDKAIGRSHLTAFVSKDDGRTWEGGLLLDERQGVSYPDGVEADDGTIYLIYDFDRRGAREILMAVFTEQDVLAGKPSETTRLRVLVNKAGDR